MRYESFYIVFNNPDRSYFAGQIISGYIAVFLQKQIKIQDITLKCIGKVLVHLGGGAIRETLGYGYHEEFFYFDWRISLLQNESYNENNNILELGRHKIPFSIQLPQNIPSSYQEDLGIVKYYLEATWKKETLSKHHQHVRYCFTVNALVDLNVIPQVNNSILKIKSKTPTICCWRTGAIDITLEIPRKGYVPGECLNFLVKISNNSWACIRGLTIEMQQKSKFWARGLVKTNTKIIVKVEGHGGLEPNVTSIWADKFIIPSLPPTNLGKCKLITINYYLKVFVLCKWTTLTLTATIIIGTIPFLNHFDDLRPINNTQRNNSTLDEIQQLELIPSVPILSAYPNLPPPSYEEAISTRCYNKDEYIEDPPPPYQNIDENSSSIVSHEFNFRPKYVTYIWNGVLPD